MQTNETHYFAEALQSDIIGLARYRKREVRSQGNNRS